MEHETHLKNKKYRQWVKAGLGLGYLKEGLAPFCDDIGNQQHKDIINRIQQTKTPQPNVPCGLCQLTTLQPDHVRVSKGICPLRQDKCNCCFPNNKIPCPNNVCGAIYDSIIQNHASVPPAPFWKNSDVNQWTADPWSVCKCFINAPGYKDKTTAADTDCTGLLHVIINNIYFHGHIGCNVSGPNNVFLKVRQYRNAIFHSSSMELEEGEANSYINDMIAVLQDGKELIHRQDAQQAVRKLQDLMKRDFIITTESFDEILRQLKDEYDDLKKKILDLEAKMSKEKQEKQDMDMEHADLKTKITVLETLVSELKKEMEQIKTETSSGQCQADYERTKIKWQKEVIASYYKNLLKVPTMPLLPRSHKCSFSEIYVMPTITREIKGDKGETKEIEVKSISEIFIKEGVPSKHIYVLGDAGSGKSSFCKYLVNCWCIAQSDDPNVEDEFDCVKEMKKFEIMFYISLRHNQDIDNVNDMIKNQYDIDIASSIPQKDSAKIIVLLDGLDEWSSKSMSHNQFQTMGVPKQDVNKDYTIVTTSRPWKIHILGISETEIEQSLNLKGFGLKCEWQMVDRIVSQLNFIKHASKDDRLCKQKLEEKSLESLKQSPIMLQQLICLWFDGKLDKTSRCAIYTSMLELFFTWNDMKTTGTSTRHIKGGLKVDLPKYLADENILVLNSHLIYEVAELAYKTLFNCPKNKSLTFDISIFNELDISDEVRKQCLKLGIITEDECPSLSVSKPSSPLFSFIHKSMQEFLAAVNICINFNTKIGSSDSTDYVREVFQKCLTVNDILEQSNEIIVLCGLEPRLATHVSKYIYDTMSEDSRVQKYRRTISSNIYSYHCCISDIQNLMFESNAEFNASCNLGSCPVFYVGDLVINRWNQYCDIICSSMDRHQIFPESVLSINVNEINTENHKITKYLPMFRHLEKIEITYEFKSTQSTMREAIDEMNTCVSETIKGNTPTLKSLSLSFNSELYDTNKYSRVCKTIVSNLRSMTNLVSIKMRDITMIHDDTRTFCDFLEVTSCLQQIHFENQKCECRKHHHVNLSKHKNLQYLYLYNAVSVIDVDTTKLEILRVHDLKDSNYDKIFDIIKKSYKLKELYLYDDNDNKSHFYHAYISVRLVRVLPLLCNLGELVLRRWRLTDSIIQSPFKMESLKSIKLNNVIMSLNTWQKFVDSLPCIPHTVHVNVLRCYITEDGEELKVDMSQEFRRGKENDAIKYVKDRNELFHVERDDRFFLIFSTKK